MDDIVHLTLMPSQHSQGEFIAQEGTSSSSCLMNRVPLEVIMQIFDFCCPLEEEKYLGLTWDPSETDFTRTLVSLTQVCHMWRAITTTSMPHLWSLVTVQCHRDNHSAQECHASWLKLCLERSISRPLYICLDIWSAYCFSSQFQIVLPYNTRWHSVRFNSFERLNIPAVMRLAPHILESASLTLPGVDHSVYSDILTAPRLRRYTWGALDAGLPPTQLTHLRVSLVAKLTSMTVILEHCPNLVEFEFYFDDETVVSPQHPVVRHRCLRSLKVTIMSKTILYDILELPALESIDLKYDSYSRRLVRNSSGLLAMLERSRCKLKSLSILDVRPSNDDLPSDQLLASPQLSFLRTLSIDRTLSSPEQLLPAVFSHLRQLSRLYFFFSNNVSSKMERTFLRMLQEHVQHINSDSVKSTHSGEAAGDDDADDVLNKLYDREVKVDLGLSKLGFDLSRLYRH